MKVQRIAKVALVAAAAAGLVAGSLVPAANAAKRSTVVIVESNQLSGLNSSVVGRNLTINGDVGYLTGAGFNYYNNEPALTKNPIFGTYRIVSQKPFRVQYTVNKGRVWSDGTPITGVDLLLSHVVSSTSYSVAAKLGDPNDSTKAPKFNSEGYNGIYDQHHVGLPTLSADQMSVTIEYDTKIPDWEITGPGPSPVHALVHMAEGKKGLQSVAANNAAKAKFLKAFNTYNAKLMGRIGEIWSNDYNINTVNSSTNPLLLVSNGGYIVQTINPAQGITLVENKRYNSGPKLNGIKTVVFRYISDGTAAAQALRNGEIDVYSGQPTADSVALLRGIPTVELIGADQGCYEHVDLRVGPKFGTSDVYNGPWAGMSAKSVELRRAFLMAWPRQAIVDTIIKPINAQAQLMNSLLVFPTAANYKEITSKSGVNELANGTQAEREAKALAIVKKYFPEASASNPVVPVNMVYAANNPRRANEFLLGKAAVEKAGFKLTGNARTDWSAVGIRSSDYDASFFAWCKTSTSAAQGPFTYVSDSSNNHLGYKSAVIDAAYKKLAAQPMTPAQITAEYVKIEKELVRDGVSLPIFRFPGVVAVNKNLKNVKPAVLSPLLVWNYWEWKY